MKACICNSSKSKDTRKRGKLVQHSHRRRDSLSLCIPSLPPSVISAFSSALCSLCQCNAEEMCLGLIHSFNCYALNMKHQVLFQTVEKELHRKAGHLTVFMNLSFSQQETDDKSKICQVVMNAQKKKLEKMQSNGVLSYINSSGMLSLMLEQTSE